MAEASNQGQGRRRLQTRLKSTRRSAVWNYFVDFKDDDGNDKAQCKRCQQVLGASTRNGTSTLLAHVRRCRGDEAAAAAEQAPRLPPPCSDSLHSSGSEDLARMVALRGYDPSFVEDDYFRSFVRRLNPEFEVPSRVAIEEMCDGICDEATRDLLDRLRRTPDGRFSLAVGKTNTLEAGEVTYIAFHFIDDEWKLHKLVAKAVVPETGPHCVDDGPILGLDVVLADVDDYDYNYVTETVLENGDRISMVAYDITDPDIRLPLESCIEETDSDRNLRWAPTAYVDIVFHSIAEWLLPHEHFTLKMFKGMMDLKLTRQERLRLLSELDLDYEWVYGQRWCACYYSLEVLSKRRGFNALADAELLVKLLCKVWKQVYRGIQKISASTCPTSNLCLAELLMLREILQPELARFETVQTVKRMHTRALDTLDNAIQNSYLVWSVPLALDPRYKLNYIGFRFKGAFGSEEAATYVSNITTNINKLYADYIKEYGTITTADHSDSANPMMATTSANPLEQAWLEHRRSQVMAAQVNSCNTETQTELNRYLQDPLVPLTATQDFDVLSWWKVHSSEYPMVARMARDALAMPTCSKLSSDQLAQVRSLLRGYSKKAYYNLKHLWLLLE